MGVPEDLAFRLFGHSCGTWFLVDDAVSGWSLKSGKHPMMLTAEYSGGPTAVCRPRTTSHPSRFAHDAHPLGHTRTCVIDKNGWLVQIPLTITSDVICAANYSCREEGLALLARLPGCSP